jgi:ABC-2 type transport system ATP-binding protein
LIQFNHVSKWFGEVIAVNDVTFTLEPGVTALLGSNGAGKSTLMKLLTGQIRPSSGELTVFGQAPFANPEVYKRLGYCPEIDAFPEHQTGRAFVNTMARFSGLSAGQAKSRTEEVLHEVGMAERANRKVGGYSKGMRQRIKLAQAMLLDPDIIVLDEPLNGLDPVGRREFLAVLQGLAERGKTILVSSHILFEVEQMTRSILLLTQGQLLAQGDLSVIRRYLDRFPQRIRIDTEEPRRLAERLVSLPYVLAVEMDARGTGIEVRTKEPDAFYDSLGKLILEEGIPVGTFHSPDNDLESIFKYLTSA